MPGGATIELDANNYTLPNVHAYDLQKLLAAIERAEKEGRFDLASRSPQKLPGFD